MRFYASFNDECDAIIDASLGNNSVAFRGLATSESASSFLSIRTGTRTWKQWGDGGSFLHGRKDMPRFRSHPHGVAVVSGQ
jgi:hypothetical protein